MITKIEGPVENPQLAVEYIARVLNLDSKRHAILTTMTHVLVQYTIAL